MPESTRAPGCSYPAHPQARFSRANGQEPIGSRNDVWRERPIRALRLHVAGDAVVAITARSWLLSPKAVRCSDGLLQR